MLKDEGGPYGEPMMEEPMMEEPMMMSLKRTCFQTMRWKMNT